MTNTKLYLDFALTFAKLDKDKSDKPQRRLLGMTISRGGAGVKLFPGFLAL
jgi:hypothetical protein